MKSKQRDDRDVLSGFQMGVQCLSEYLGAIIELSAKNKDITPNKIIENISNDIRAKIPSTIILSACFNECRKHGFIADDTLRGGKL